MIFYFIRSLHRSHDTHSFDHVQWPHRSNCVETSSDKDPREIEKILRISIIRCSMHMLPSYSSHICLEIIARHLKIVINHPREYERRKNERLSILKWSASRRKVIKSRKSVWDAPAALPWFFFVKEIFKLKFEFHIEFRSSPPPHKSIDHLLLFNISDQTLLICWFTIYFPFLSIQLFR